MNTDDARLTDTVLVEKLTYHGAVKAADAVRRGIVVPIDGGTRLAHVVPVRSRDHASRNEPCPCGSGRKYKRCCGEQ